MLQTAGEPGLSKKQTGGELVFGDFDVADGPDDVQAIRVEQMAFIEDNNEAPPILVQVDDVIAQELYQILHPVDSSRKREVELGKNLAEQPSLGQSGSGEDEDDVMFGEEAG